jgi:uncharacterized protein YukE
MRLAQFLNETDKKDKASQLKAKIAKLKADYKDMNVTPTSQKMADAIDAARDEIKDAERELAALSEGMDYDAQSAYQRRSEEVRALLTKVGQLLDRHAQAQQQSANHWTHAGDLANVAESLQEIVTFLESGE